MYTYVWVWDVRQVEFLENQNNPKFVTQNGYRANFSESLRMVLGCVASAAHILHLANLRANLRGTSRLLYNMTLQLNFPALSLCAHAGTRANSRDSY